MGQKSSHISEKLSKTTFPLRFLLNKEPTTHTHNPEQPIKFQYKTKRKKLNKDKTSIKTAEQKLTNNNVKKISINNATTLNNIKNQSEVRNLKDSNLKDITCRIIKTQNAVTRTKSEPSLTTERIRDKRHKHRKRNAKLHADKSMQQFGYKIEDVDAFLNKATIEKPANIPVVLAFPSVLYQTRAGGYQVEISLPLGMVVNAVFKNQHWLYVQTPHAEEGYVSYTACLPLGIIPPPDDDAPAPCWEKSTDVFPKPSGNMTDTEKLSSRSGCSGRRCYSRRSRPAASTCSERSVDKLYLRAAASARIGGTRRTLLVAGSDFDDERGNTLCVRKGDVVTLLSTHVKGWFWVRDKEGSEGFIPAAVAGHGFL